jgi:hypothetical protein
MSDPQTHLIISLAKRFIEGVLELEPAFEKAYFRFQAEQRSYHACASYSTAAGVELVDALDSGEFIDGMTDLFVQLVAEIETVPVLFLLVVDNNYDYEMKYEYDDLSKWAITRMDGGTGVPAGLE